MLEVRDAASVLRHKRTCARKRLCELYTVRINYTANVAARYDNDTDDVTSPHV